MTLGLATTLRNARLDQITAAIDAGTAGLLRIYDGSRPATGGAATTLLAELTLSDPSSGAAAGGVLTFSAITAGRERECDRDCNMVPDCHFSCSVRFGRERGYGGSGHQLQHDFDRDRSQRQRVFPGVH